MDALLASIKWTILQQLITCLSWSSLFILLKPFGIYYSIITDKSSVMRIQKRINRSSGTCDSTPIGFSYGKWYCLYITFEKRFEGNAYICSIISTKASYAMLTDEEQTQSTVVVEKAAPICIYERTGTYTSVWYRSRTICLDYLAPTKRQDDIVKDIISLYEKKRSCVVMLHGPPGTGKSMVGIFLTTHYSSSYCNTFIPWRAGDSLAELYSSVMPTSTNPLVIVFEEFDIPLINIHNGKVDVNNQIPTSITDKSSWNQFFDEINRNVYPWLILILTTNKTPQYIHDHDPSYIRKGRVDKLYELSDDTLLEAKEKII